MSKAVDDWNMYLATVDSMMPLGIRFQARPESLARDGVEIVAWMPVSDACSDDARTVNAMVSDFPPAFDGPKMGLAVVRVLGARLLAHEFDETLVVNGKRAFNPHTEK